jgi:type IV secretory pathway VirJ component
MRRQLATAVLALLTLVAPARADERLSHGRFNDVRLYRPTGEVRQFVLFLSGKEGWSASLAAQAQALSGHGAMVAGIDLPGLFRDLEADGGDCTFPDGDLENLSRYIQGYAHLPRYYTPLLVGYDAGAALGYAMAAQAEPGTISAAVSLAFCPVLPLKKPLCERDGTGLAGKVHKGRQALRPAKKLGVPWIALLGTRDPICAADAAAFVAQVPGARQVPVPAGGHTLEPAADWTSLLLADYDRLSASRTIATAPPPAKLIDLPLVEVPVQGNRELFAVMLSGDGGWAGLDKDVAAALTRKGISVVGLDSLRYFWSARTPQGLAADLDRVIRYYAAQWKKSRVLLIGYSQGANVLPFAVNRLPAASKALLAQTVLMGLEERASFEFHVGNWIGQDDDGLPILPEASKLAAAATLCLYGEEEDDSLCPKIPPGHVQAHALAGGHHFDGAYDALAELILARVSTK